MSVNNEHQKNDCKKGIPAGWIVIVTIVVLLLFIGVPILVDILYVQGGPIITVWDGPEFLSFYGAALSAIGALFLGGISIWQNAMLRKQNDKLREENKESQKTIEKLYKTANELSIINKIIDNESQRINCLAKECL